MLYSCVPSVFNNKINHVNDCPKWTLCSRRIFNTWEAVWNPEYGIDIILPISVGKTFLLLQRISKTVQISHPYIYCCSLYYCHLLALTGRHKEEEIWRGPNRQKNPDEMSLMGKLNCGHLNPQKYTPWILGMTAIFSSSHLF